jgi:GH25 family lysozyme M1 (1,4-beta-N-acetylmuramidase)
MQGRSAREHGTLGAVRSEGPPRAVPSALFLMPIRTRPTPIRHGRLATLVVLLLAVSTAAGAAVGDGFTGASGDATLLPGAPPAYGPQTTTPGIDVSHWQGTIDWQQVAASGVRFAFMKATESDWYVDRTYGANRRNALANGILVGAYHFARPGPEAGDAVREARHFLRNAGVRAGHLLPVLDIEVSGGLGPTALTRWALDWVRTVRRELGVTPLLYTSPSGWETRFGNSTALARAGVPLWIAHWGVAAPRVPAYNWDGRGWTVWQYSATGRVPGIAGNVDLNRFRGTNLGRITVRRLRVQVDSAAGWVTSAPKGYACASSCERLTDPGVAITLTAVAAEGGQFRGWSGACTGTDLTCTVMMNGNRWVGASFTFDTTPPTAALEPPTGATGPVVVRFSERVTGVTAQNLALRHANGTPLASSRTCRTGGGVVVDCTTGRLRSVTFSPAAPWLAGAPIVVDLDPPGTAPVVDLVGNPAESASLPFVAPARIEDTDVRLAHAWRSVDDVAAIGGSYAVERHAGATFAYRFSGPTATWFTKTGAAQGKAEVWIDGRSVGVFDQYGPRGAARVARRFTGLGRGWHELVVRVLGRARAAATDRLVVVDAFSSEGDLRRDPVGPARWRSAPGLSGGSFAVSGLAGATLTARFHGTGVDLTTVVGPDRGRADVVVDGKVRKTIDLYAAERGSVVRRVRGLDPGRHVLQIVVAGTRQRASVDRLVAIDRIDAVPAP